MSDTSEMGRKREGLPGRRRPLVDDELADQLLGRAQAEDVELLGPEGAVVPGDQGGAGTGAGRGDDRPPGL